MTRLLLILFLLSSCGITAQAQWGSPRNCRELNSVSDDFAPVWSSSQRLLYINSERTGRSLFYIASQNSPTQFSPPAVLESPLNAKRGNQSYLTVSANGSAYLSCFTLGEQRPYLSIYQSEQVGSVWKQPSPVEELADESFGAHPTVSKDGLTLIFSSNREGGSGGIDLWITRKQNDGKWSQPLNLGESINSTGNEITPFLIGDSLYFSSDGWGGKGGYELFLSVKNAGLWQAPVPLSELNSESDESDFTLLDSQTALFGSNRTGGLGGIDIYQTHIERDNSTATPLPLEMMISTLVPNIIVQESIGKEVITIFPSIFYAQNSDALPNELLTKPLEANAKINLLPKDSVAINSLNLLGFRLSSCETCTLSITGWADKSSPLENARLASLRAENIKNYFVSIFQVPANRIRTQSAVHADTAITQKYRGLYSRVDFQSNSLELLEPIEYNQSKRTIRPAKLECTVDARPRQNVRSWRSSVAGVSSPERTNNLPQQFTITTADVEKVVSGDSLVITAYGKDSSGRLSSQNVVLPIQHTSTTSGQATQTDYFLSSLDAKKAGDQFEEIIMDENLTDETTHELLLNGVTLAPFPETGGKIHPQTKAAVDEMKSRAAKHNIQVKISPRKTAELPASISKFAPFFISIILDKHEK
ncbi:MAG: PD40 domain-containing protein [Ignavibacteria bacterium]|nr:PD40 domain-containing protein [Ignavibacteria bacterium]